MGGQHEVLDRGEYACVLDFLALADPVQVEAAVDYHRDLLRVPKHFRRVVVDLSHLSAHRCSCDSLHPSLEHGFGQTGFYLSVLDYDELPGLGVAARGCF